MVAAAFLIVVLGGYAASLGEHVVSYPFLKLRYHTGTLSKHGYDELANVSVELGKYEGAQRAHLAQFKSYGDAQALAKLGKLQLRLGENKAAASTYSVYFDRGGTDWEAAYLYGGLLDRLGKSEDALKFFELAVTQSEQRLPVLSTTAIVRLLIKQGRYKEAHARVIAFRSASDQAKGYLNTELKQLKDYFSTSKRSPSAI